LRYALAEHLCCEYTIKFGDSALNKLKSYESRLRALSPSDLTMMKLSTFARKTFVNYADVNLSGGWTTP
jgi:hypothetical protein